MEDRERQMLDELLEDDNDFLRPKEIEFIDDLHKRDKRKNYTLSEAQLAWLEVIWKRVILTRKP